MKRSTKIVDSAFYCAKKLCRKSAWETPEYLSEEDWEFLRKIVKVLESGTADEFYELLWSSSPLGHRFLNHTMGWPEGVVYCGDRKYTVVTAFPSIIRHDLVKFKGALAKHDNGS